MRKYLKYFIGLNILICVVATLIYLACCFILFKWLHFDVEWGIIRGMEVFLSIAALVCMISEEEITPST